MLETIRAYAAERFKAAPDKEFVRERHYQHYLELAQRHGDDRTLSGVDRKDHLARLDADIDNLHAALTYALGHDDPERALAMTAALGRYWIVRTRHADAANWIDQALAKPRADARAGLHARLLCIKAMALLRMRRRAEEHAALTEAETVARGHGDPASIAEVLATRAAHEAFLGRRDVAEPLADAASNWAITAADDSLIAIAAVAQATVPPTIAELRERVDRAASLLEAAGNVYELGRLLAGVAAYGALLRGSEQDAKEYLARAAPIADGLDDPIIWITIRGNFGLAALLTGDTEAAEDAFRDELARSRELVVLPFGSEALQGLAAVAAVHGDDHRAARLLGAAEDRVDRAQDAVEARLAREFFEPARARHGAEAWDAAVREGAALSFQDAIAYALDEPRA